MSCCWNLCEISLLCQSVVFRSITSLQSSVCVQYTRQVKWILLMHSV